MGASLVWLAFGCGFDASALGTGGEATFGLPTADSVTSSGAGTGTGSGTTASGTAAASSGTEGEGGAPPIAFWRRKLSFRSAALMTGGRDVPVLVHLTPERIDYDLTGAGNNIEFVAFDGTRLAHEVQTWNPGSDSWIWVRIPEISDSPNGRGVWLRYGPGAEATSDPEAVWAHPYVAVWHLERSCTESPPQQFDATGRGHDASCAEGVDERGRVGAVGRGLTFAPEHGPLEVASADALAPEGGVTLEYWVRLAAQPTDTLRAAMRKHGSYVSYVLRGGGGGADPEVPRFSVSLAGRVRSVRLDHPLALERWVYVVNTWDPETGVLRFFVDGEERGRSVVFDVETLDASDEPLLIGDWVPGALDEVRISAGAVSSAYVRLQHLTMVDQALVFGPEEPFFAG